MGLLSRKKAAPAQTAQPAQPAPSGISVPAATAGQPAVAPVVSHTKAAPSQSALPGVTADGAQPQSVLPSPPRSPVHEGCEPDPVHLEPMPCCPSADQPSRSTQIRLMEDPARGTVILPARRALLATLRTTAATQQTTVPRTEPTATPTARTATGTERPLRDRPTTRTRT